MNTRRDFGRSANLQKPPLRRFKPDQRFKPAPRRVPKKRFVRKKLFGTSECPRLVVFRSHKHIYGQLADDSIKRTLTTVSSHSRDLRASLSDLSDHKEAARAVGRALAAKALSMNFKRVVFDGNGYPYEGRVKWLAQGVREGGVVYYY